MADARLVLDVDVDVSGDKDLAGLGDKLDKTTKHAESLSAGTRKLSSQFDKAQASAKRLRKAFDETGDTDLLPALRKAELQVKRLSQWQQHLGGETRKHGDETVRTTARISGAWGMLSASVAGSSNNMIKWLAKPQVLVAALGAATVASAAVSGAALAGFGAGLIGLGAFALRGSKQVRSALEGLGENARVTLSAAAQGMEKPFVAALRHIETSIADLGPDLRAMFDNVTPSIGNLAAGLTSLAERAMPGLRNASKGAGDVLDDLAGVLPTVGDAMSSLGSSLNAASEGGGKALVATITSLSSGIRILGNVMEFSAKGFDLWTRANPVLADGLGVSDRAMKKAADSAKSLDSAVKASAQGFSSYAATTQASKAGVEALERANLNLAKSFRDVTNAALASLSTEIGAIEARHRATEELKDGTKSLNINTAAGRENLSALRDQVAAAIAYGEAEGKRTRNQALGTAATKRHTDAMYNDAVAAGVSKSAIDGLWRSLGLLPPSKSTKVTTPGAPVAKKQIQDVTDAATRMPRARATAISSPGAPRAKVDIDKVSDAATRMPRSKTTNIQQRGGEMAKRVIEGVISSVFRMPTSRTTTLNIITRRTTYTYVAPAGSLGSRIDRSEEGNIYSFAGGGLPRAKIARPGTLYQWAEPKTGGEAFIPKRGDWGRSTGILAQAADWYDMRLSPKAAAAPNVTVNARVFIGDREISDIVRVECDPVIDYKLAQGGRALSYGRR